MGGLKKIVLIALVVAVAGVARADDLAPPAYRGMPLGVEGHWHVGDGTTFNPLNVHIYNRVTPDPREMISPIPPTITQDGPIYTIIFPDWVDNQPLKLGRIQLYWVSSDPTLFPVMDPALFPGTGITGFEGTDSNPGVVVDQSPVAGSIPGYYFDFIIRPNPDHEQISFTFFSGATGGLSTAQLQEVDIDTVSIPEPVMISWLGLGGLIAFRRR